MLFSSIKEAVEFSLIHSASMARAHRWCFTVNNYTEETVHKIKEWLTEKTCKYAIVGREVGEQTKTPHLQGFINFHQKLRFTTLKNKIHDGHYEVARGTDEDNKKYCEKGGDLLLEVAAAGGCRC